jgi:hypothetical protein
MRRFRWEVQSIAWQLSAMKIGFGAWSAFLASADLTDHVVERTRGVCRKLAIQQSQQKKTGLTNEIIAVAALRDNPHQLAKRVSPLIAR